MDVDVLDVIYKNLKYISPMIVLFVASLYANTLIDLIKEAIK